jgi:glycosyltransferase involved in cell wall biosynthesis
MRLDRQYQVARVLAQAIGPQRIGLIHTHGVAAQIQGGLAGRLSHTPVVSHCHDTFDPSFSGNGLLHRAAAFTPRAATIAVSDGVRASLLNHVRGSDIDVIPNGVNAAVVAPAPDAPAAPLVLWCGRLQRWKGCHTFLRAARIVRDAYPDTRFAVVGGALFGMDPEYPDEVHRLAEALGLGDAVLFTGHVSDVRPWLAASSFVTHSAIRADPFPLIVLEGMMQSRAVVAFNRGGPAEAIIDGVTGRLMAADTPEGLAAGIAELLASPETAIRMGQAGRQRALEHYNQERMVRRIEAIYDRVLNGVRRA